MVPLMFDTGATEGFSSGSAARERMVAGGVVAMVPVMFSMEVTEESSNGGAAGARTGAGRVVAMVPVMLGTGAKTGQEGLSPRSRSCLIQGQLKDFLRPTKGQDLGEELLWSGLGCQQR